MDGLLAVRVASKRQAADAVCVLELESTDGSPLPTYTPGAHIDLHLPGGVTRQYSLSAYRVTPLSYQVAVLREPASRGGSQAVHEKLNEGDTLKISTPRNLFELHEDAAPALLLAGGIGITPLLCMAEVLVAHGREFELHYCGRSKSRMAFLERLTALGQPGQTHIHTDDGDAQQRLDIQAVLRRHARDTHLYICGPAGFIDAMIDQAAAAGWPADQIHFERFSMEGVSKGNGIERAFEVQLASTGARIAVGTDESVVEALARHGIEIETSCEQGICGTCLTGVIAGEPDHRDMYLSEADRNRNDQFLPCCSRSKGPLLVLDL